MTTSLLSRGAFIVIEGCDRSGKSTQCKKIVNLLSATGHKAELMVFPDRSTPIGSIIDNFLTNKCDLSDKAIHLLFTANRWEKEVKILQTLRSGTTIIIDRYSYSGVAYSSAKKGMSMDWCKAPEEGLPKPDLVLFLDLKPEAFLQRNGFGKERYETSDFQKLVARAYEALKDDSWKVVDADKPQDELATTLLNIVKPIIEDCKDKPIQLLW